MEKKAKSDSSYKDSYDPMTKPNALELGHSSSPQQDSPRTPILTSDRKDGWNAYIISAGLVCALSSFSYGYNISDVGDASSIFLSCNESLIQASTGTFPSCVIVGSSWNFVVAAFCLGGLFGALATGRLTDRFGRKRVLIAHNAFYVVGAAFMTFATHLSMLIIGRLLIGLASGMCTVVVPMYLGEIAPDRIRGQLSTMHQAAIVLGILIAQCLSAVLLSDYWRVLFGLSGLPALIQMALIPLYCESPKYQASKGYIEEATQSLRKLRGRNDVEDEVALWTSKEAVSTSEPIYNELKLLRLPEARVSLTIGIIFHAAQQLSGINTVFYFTKPLFDAPNMPSKWIAVYIGICNLFMTGVSIWLIDRAGRRPLILSSTLLMCTAGILMTVARVNEWNTLLLIFVLMFVGSFAIGLGPVPWVITADIFPANALNAGASYCIGSNWIFNTIVALSTLKLKDALQELLFVPFAAIMAAFGIFAFFAFRETMGQPVGFARFRKFSL